MWIQETIINWIEPFTKRYYLRILFKYNSQYWAIQTRIEWIFENHQDDIKNLFIRNILDKIPLPYNTIFENLFKWDLWENIEKLKDDVLEHPVFWVVISEYFLNNSEFQKLSNKLFINLQSFREIFDNEIWVYLKWWKINEKLLLKEKKYAIKFLLDWVKEFEKICLKQITQFKDNIEPRLIFDNPLPLTKIEIEEINGKIKELAEIVETWENHKFYEDLLKIFDNIFDEMIDIIR